MLAQTLRAAACVVIAATLSGVSSSSARADYTATGSASYGPGPLGVDGVHVTGNATWGVTDDTIQWVEVVFKRANGTTAYTFNVDNMNTDPLSPRKWSVDGRYYFLSPGTYTVEIQFFASEGGTLKKTAACGTVTVPDEDEDD